MRRSSSFPPTLARPSARSGTPSPWLTKRPDPYAVPSRPRGREGTAMDARGKALTPTPPLRGANIGCDVVRRTIFAGPRPDVPVRGRGELADHERSSVDAKESVHWGPSEPHTGSAPGAAW